MMADTKTSSFIHEAENPVSELGLRRMRVIYYRCSSLPLLFKCAAAGQRPDVVVHDTCEAAEVGTDVHKHIQQIVETGHTGPIQHSETRALVSVGRRLWFQYQPALGASLRELFPAPVCERELSVEVSRGIVVTGHTDVQSGMVGTCRVLDWKTGRVDSDYSQQLLGYAALAMLENYAIERVETHIVWLREQDIEHYTMTRDELPAWVRRIERIANWRGSYESGSHCAHCPRAHECPGWNALVRRDASALLDEDVESLESRLALMEPDRMIELVRRARMVAKVAERIVSAARAHVARVGEVAGSESRLTISTTRLRVLDAFSAWPVLQEHLDDRELATCCKVSLSQVEELVAKKAPPRQGAAAKRELRQQLEEADAVHYGSTNILTEKRRNNGEE
jgi:hypothetical protein